MFKIKVAKPEISDDGRRAFESLAGADGEIDAFELQNILNKVFVKDFKFDGFSADMTRGMVAVRDYDMSGRLGYDDFKKLWADLTLCKRTFMSLDADGNGYFDRSEFKRALDSLGMGVSDNLLKALLTRYSDKQHRVSFDEFVACYMKLKTMLKTYKSKDETNGEVTFELDEFVQLCVYS